MRRFIRVVAVVLVGFAATGCATGGYLGPKPYGGPLGDVMAGNLAITCPGDYFVGGGINRCLRDIGGDFGRYSNHPMYRGGMGGPQLSQADKLSVFCGLGGSAVAMLLDASVKKILGAGFLSAAVCEVAASVSNRGNKQPQGQQVRIASDGTPVAVGRPVIPAAQGYQPIGDSVPSDPKWYIRNMTGGRGELWNGNRFIKVLEPGESYGVLNPSGVKLVILVPTKEGTLEPAEALRKPRRDGWDMVVPSVQ